MSRIVLPSISAGESRRTSFDFASQLGVGETVSSQVCLATVFSGVDSSPTSVISGAATSSGTVVTQLLYGNVAGAIYDVVCTITTSLGQTLKMGGYLAVPPEPV